MLWLTDCCLFMGHSKPSDISFLDWQTCEELDVQSPIALLQYAANDVHSLPARSQLPSVAACRGAGTSLSKLVHMQRGDFALWCGFTLLGVAVSKGRK